MAALPADHPLRQEASDVKYYATVSEAISSSREEGGRIVVHPGVYNESILLDKPVSLIGASRLLW